MASSSSQNEKAIAANEQQLQRILRLEDMRELRPEEILGIKQKLQEVVQTFHDIMNSLTGDEDDDERAKCQIKAAIAMYTSGYYERDENLVRKALDMNRKGLSTLDSLKHIPDCIDGYINLADCLSQVALVSTGDEMEKCWVQASSALNAAEFLIRKQENPLQLALVRKSMVGILEECYFGERDENLFDAIRAAELSLLALREHAEQYPIAAPMLLNYIGNCYMKRNVNRSKSIQLGHDAYELGLNCVDAENFPELKQTLKNNLAWAKTVLEQGQMELPEKEMVRRFSAKIKEHIDNSDLVEAEKMAWSFMRWGWSLPYKPNVHVAYAHNILGNIFHALKNIDTASSHFYSAQVVLLGTVPPEHPYFKGITEMKAMFAKCLEELGQADSLSNYEAQADSALNNATVAQKAGIEIVEKESEKASLHFESALGFYPYDPISLFYRANIRWQQQNYHFALQDYDLSILLLPNNVAALVNRGNLKLSLNDARGAWRDFDEVLKEQPKHGSALWGRANSLIQEGKWDKAIEDINKYIALNPQELTAYIMRSRSFEELGDIENATKDLEQSLSLSTGQKDKDFLKKEMSRLGKKRAKE